MVLQARRRKTQLYWQRSCWDFINNGFCILSKNVLLRQVFKIFDLSRKHSQKLLFNSLDTVKFHSQQYVYSLYSRLSVPVLRLMTQNDPSVMLRQSKPTFWSFFRFNKSFKKFYVKNSFFFGMHVFQNYLFWVDAFGS